MKLYKLTFGTSTSVTGGPDVKYVAVANEYDFNPLTEWHNGERPAKVEELGTVQVRVIERKDL